MSNSTFSQNVTPAVNNKSPITTFVINNESPAVQKPFPCEFGFQAGTHSSNLNDNRPGFNSNLFLEVYLKFSLSEKVHSIIAFTYWKAVIPQVNTPFVQIPPETINSKGAMLELDFSLVKIHNIQLLFGPSVALENITGAENAVFTFGANLKLDIPVWENKISVVPAVSYRNGTEAFDFGGGGIDYSFFTYMIGVEANLGN